MNNKFDPENVSFIKNEKTVEIAKNIFLVKNFLSEREFGKYYKIIQCFDEDSWNEHFSREPGDLSDFWKDKLSPDFIDYVLTNAIVNFLAPEYWPLKHQNVCRLKTGESSNGIIKTKNNKKGYGFSYNLAFYFGEFTGGELCIEGIEFKYKPEPNDLIIFDADYSYEIKKVTGGTRYSYIDYIHRHPGYYIM